MAQEIEIEVGKLFRHKKGKLYRIENSYPDKSQPRWGALVGPDGRTVFGEPDEHGSQRPLPDKSKVYATQWQVNEKYPEGREYQAARELKIADLTAV